MKKLSLLLFALLLTVGCSGTKNLPETDQGKVPKWFINVPVEEGKLFASTTATSRDMQLAIDKAITDARAEIAASAQAAIESIQEAFSEEVGRDEMSTYLTSFSSATRVVTDMTLQGSVVLERSVQDDSGVWRAYILMEYSTVAAYEAFLDEVAKEEELYTRFRASEAFKRLDAQLEKKKD